jgi:hypothetical protein
MPAIEKAVIFDLRTGLGVEKSLHLQIEMSGLWQQRNHCGKALYSINRQPSSTRYEILRFYPIRYRGKNVRFKQDGNCSLRL